ncbi:hypothetical protein ANCDUO_24973, partial [Ancylostoma duodenale]
LSLQEVQDLEVLRLHPDHLDHQDVQDSLVRQAEAVQWETKVYAPSTAPQMVVRTLRTERVVVFRVRLTSSSLLLRNVLSLRGKMRINVLHNHTAAKLIHACRCVIYGYSISDTSNNNKNSMISTCKSPPILTKYF